MDLAKQEYREHNINHSEWLEFRAEKIEDGSLPLGQLPFIEIDGFRLAESTSILRFLSKQCLLVCLTICRFVSPGANSFMEAMIDMMIEGWNDVITGYFTNLFSDPGVLKSWLCRLSILLTI